MTNGLTEISRDAYRLEPGNQHCIVCESLAGVSDWENYINRHVRLWGRAATRHLRRSGVVEIHHLIPGTRKDYRSNLVPVHPLTHAWLHDHPQEQIVVCLWVKWCRNELEWDEINAAAGTAEHPKNMRARIESFELESPFSDWREELTCPTV